MPPYTCKLRFHLLTTLHVFQQSEQHGPAVSKAFSVNDGWVKYKKHFHIFYITELINFMKYCTY